MIKYEKIQTHNLLILLAPEEQEKKYSEYIEYKGMYFAFFSSGIVINVLKYIERKESNNGTRISN